MNGAAKREEMVDIFSEGKLKFLVLMKIKLKGNREVSWCGVNGIIASVQEMERAREDVAILLSDVWQSAVINFGYVRLLTLKFSGLNSSFLGFKFMWW